MLKKLLTFWLILISFLGIFYVVPRETSAADCSVTTSGECTVGSYTCTKSSIFSQPVCRNTSGQLIDPQTNKAPVDANNAGLGNAIFGAMARGIGYFLLVLSSNILQISGSIFDFVVKYSIVDMAKHIGNPEGVGGSITLAWATLRDLAYLFFIFLLLFAAFEAMFELQFGNVTKRVRDIIIVALLIGFSSFFSKVVIDASNIVSVGFYNAIVSTDGSGNSKRTISSGYENMLGVRKWYDAKPLEIVKDPEKILLTGVLASVFMFITAIILLISAIMFVARFVILIFLIVLSPLAAIAYVVPKMQKHFEDWKGALISQSFFAPLFFALTWVVFKIGSENNAFLASLGAKSTDSLSSLATSPASSSAGILLNYFIIIGFAIAALIFSKKMAMEGSNLTHFGAISGAIGGAAIGGTAMLGRQTIGRGAKAIVESGKLRNAALSNKWYSGAAKAGLWTANRGAEGSFDLRASTTISKIPNVGKELEIAGKAGGKGGFNQMVKDKVEAKSKYAKVVYSQTEGEKDEFERRKELETKDRTDKDGNRIKGILTLREEKATETQKVSKETEKNRRSYMESKTSEFSENIKELNKQKKTKEAELKAAKGDKEKVENINKELGSIAERIQNERDARKEREKEIEETDDDYNKLKEDADKAKEAAKKAKEQLKKKDIDDEELSKETQDIKKAGENRLKTYAEQVKKASPVSTVVGAAALGAALTPFGPLGMAIGAGAGAILGKTAGSKLPDKYNWAGNKAAAKKIKTDAGGKSKKDALADAYRAYEKEQNPETKTETEAKTQTK